jgi:hypothetical protein
MFIKSLFYRVPVLWFIYISKDIFTPVIKIIPGVYVVLYFNEFMTCSAPIRPANSQSERSLGDIPGYCLNLILRLSHRETSRLFYQETAGIFIRTGPNRGWSILNMLFSLFPSKNNEIESFIF